MTASLYQSESCAGAGSGTCAGVCGTGVRSTWTLIGRSRESDGSEEVVEIPLAAHRMPHTQNVRRSGCRIEQYEVAGTAPKEMGSRQQVMRLKWPAGIEAKRCEIELQPAGLPVMGIEVGDDDDRIRLVGRHFAVDDQHLVVTAVEG